MKTKMRDLVLPRLVRSLTRFYPECVEQFLCPVCLRYVSARDMKQITEAHILPRAVVAGPTTLLCKGCNDRHGRLQDKWFGEHLNIALSKRSVLGIREQRGYFKIGGVRVGGKFEQRADGSISFVYESSKTSPAALEAVEHQFGRPTMQLEVPIPLTEKRNQRLALVGFLTAAYLMMFRELGYSWALQRHLDPIRQQIMQPDVDICPIRISNPVTRLFERPFAGVGQINGEAVLVVGIAERVVLLPSADYPELIERFEHEKTLHVDRLREFRFYRDHVFDGPIVLCEPNRVLVAPDVLPTAKDWYAIVLPPDGSKPVICQPNTVKLDIVPTFDKLTGRPEKTA